MRSASSSAPPSRRCSGCSEVSAILSGFQTGYDLIVLGTLVEPREESPRLRRDDRCFIVLPREGADGRDGIEAHDRDEFHLGLQAPAEELDPLEAGDLTLLDTQEDLMPEERLVGVRVFRFRPAMPDSTDHLSGSFLMDTAYLILLNRPAAHPLGTGALVTGTQPFDFGLQAQPAATHWL